jgi:hypothetical protein
MYLKSAKPFSSGRKAKQTTDQRTEEVGRLPVIDFFEKRVTMDGTKEIRFVSTAAWQIRYRYRGIPSGIRTIHCSSGELPAIKNVQQQGFPRGHPP